LTLARHWWPEDSLRRHFRDHGADLGARTLEDYLHLALLTIERGERFAFRQTSRRRIGYYHRRSRRLVIVRDDDETILSLYLCSENNVRTLPDSTYPHGRRRR
jgi:hypothetical protein